MPFSPFFDISVLHDTMALRPTLELLVLSRYSQTLCHPPTRSAFSSDAANDHHIDDLYDLLFGYADSDWATMMDIRH
jgi:hypothetical protein